MIAIWTLLLTPACTPRDAPPSRTDVLVVAVPTDFDNLLSVVANAATDRALVQELVPPLLRPRLVDCDLRWEPGLAEGHRWVDARTLELTLKADVRWSDGAPLTAADVVATHRLIRDPTVASPFHPDSADMAGPPQALGPTTVRFTWPEPIDPDVALWHATQVPPVPAHALAGADPATLRGHPLAASSPRTAGPWAIERWDRGSRLTLARTSTDAGPARVVFRVLPEYTTRLLELEAGRVDVLDNLDIDDVGRLEASPAIRLVSRGHRSLEWVLYNRRRPPLDDRRVREALSRAIDVDALVRELLTTPSGRAWGVPASGTVNPELCGVARPEPVAFDPARARALLDEAGWRDTDGDGVRDRSGEPLRLTLSTNAGNPRRAAAAVRIQAALARVGVAVDLLTLEPHTFFGTLRRREFTLALTGRSAMLVGDLAPLWRSGEDQAWNATGYADAETDRLIARSRLGDARALELALQRIADDHPARFLYWREDVVAVRTRWEAPRADGVSPWRELHRWR